MLSYKPLLTSLAFALAILTSVIQAESAPKASIFPSSTIKTLEKDIADIKTELAELPPRNFKPLNGYLGYHSAITPAKDPSEKLNNIVDFQLQDKAGKNVTTIAIMPASNPRYSPDAAYGFPRRFRIEMLDEPDGPPIKVFDYSKQDYPEAKLTPLVISNINTTANIIRIVVDHGVVKDGWEYFAIGEVFIFANGDYNTTVNVAPYASVRTTNAFESQATWSPYYLKDRMTPFNMPLGTQWKEKSDFVAMIPVNEEEEPQIQVIIDLLEKRPLGRIEFYPAKPPWEISLPHFGYPGSIAVETFRDSDFSQEPTIKREIANSWDKTRSMVLGDIFFSVPIYTDDARYVRITFSELPIHGDSRIFAMGEISVLRSGLNVSKNKPVSVFGIPQQDLDPSLLVDNHTYNQQIIHPEVWLLGLSKRHKLEKQLHALTLKLDLALEDRERRLNATVLVLLTLVATGVLVMYIRSRLTRTRELNQIRKQISNDLHDDVGSSIGAFSLGMERLRNHEHTPAVDKVTQDLRILAKEAAVALREAVWLTKQDSISLQDLGTMIKERAYFILGKDRVLCQMEESLPEFQISLIHKRNIMLLFKEALHNFVKHAHTDQLYITFRRGRNHSLLLQIKDEGVGIEEKESKRKGWGLSTMATRAKQIGGDLQIISQSGKGTCLELRIPISTLRKK